MPEGIFQILQEGLKPHNYKNYFYFLLFVEEVDLELSISKCSMMLDISRGVNGNHKPLIGFLISHASFIHLKRWLFL